MEKQNVDFNIKSWLPVIATVYGEGANQDFGTKVQIASTILNRAESGRAEFGADTGNITDVLQRGYYAYSKQSPKFLEAMNQKFPDKMSEDAYKDAVAAVSGLISGKLKRADAQFFLTPKELSKIKRTGSMNMALLEKTGANDTYTFFKYKQNGRKLKAVNPKATKETLSSSETP